MQIDVIRSNLSWLKQGHLLEQDRVLLRLHMICEKWPANFLETIGWNSSREAASPSENSMWHQDRWCDQLTQAVAWSHWTDDFDVLLTWRNRSLKITAPPPPRIVSFLSSSKNPRVYFSSSINRYLQCYLYSPIVLQIRPWLINRECIILPPCIEYHTRSNVECLTAVSANYLFRNTVM